VKFLVRRTSGDYISAIMPVREAEVELYSLEALLAFGQEHGVGEVVLAAPDQGVGWWDRTQWLLELYDDYRE
jgi:hypothetical protein